MNWLIEQQELLQNFISDGGDLLWGIAILLLLLWAFLIERSYYFLVLFPKYSQKRVAQWLQRKDLKSWHALQIRQCWLAQAELKLKTNMAFLDSLIRIFPLLGLLGTVTGMIHVFDVVAIHGTGNPRLLAAGISMATIPTMSGLVCALSGLFIYSRLQSYRKKLFANLALQLSNRNIREVS